MEGMVEKLIYLLIGTAIGLLSQIISWLLRRATDKSTQSEVQVKLLDQQVNGILERLDEYDDMLDAVRSDLDKLSGASDEYTNSQKVIIASLEMAQKQMTEVVRLWTSTLTSLMSISLMRPRRKSKR